MMRKKVILFCIICLPMCCFSQRKVDFRFWEDSLVTLRQEVINERDEDTRLSLNQDFMNVLESVLMHENSLDFAWDSVSNFSALTSPDQFFKIFTWAVIHDDYTYENFGFIQFYNKYRKKVIVLPLYDKQLALSYPKTMVADHNMWYGAVYYKIVPISNKDKTYYTLLGHNGKDLFHQEKIIEVLEFRLKSTRPVYFGARIFSKYAGRVARVIIPYAKNATLSLKFEEQSYDVKVGWNKKTRRPIYKNYVSDMIIFETTIPTDNKMPELPAYMVPESSLNECFIPKNGRWVYLEKVNGRVPATKQLPRKYNDNSIYSPVKNNK